MLCYVLHPEYHILLHHARFIFCVCLYLWCFKTLVFLVITDLEFPRRVRDVLYITPCQNYEERPLTGKINVCMADLLYSCIFFFSNNWKCLGKLTMQNERHVVYTIIVVIFLRSEMCAFSKRVLESGYTCSIYSRKTVHSGKFNKCYYKDTKTVQFNDIISSDIAKVSFVYAKILHFESRK